MISLYDYQERCVEDIRSAYRSGKRAPLLQLATGGGKTIIFSYIAMGAQKLGKRVLVLVHRQELLDQVCATLAQFDVRHGVIDPLHQFVSKAQTQVASIFTLIRRLERTPPPDLIIIDEAHHATLKSTWGKVIAHWPRAKLLGVTATPCRLSGEGLGDIFDCLITGPAPQALIDAGRLSAVRVFAPPTISTAGLHTRMGEYVTAELQTLVDRPSVTGDAIEHYQKITSGARAAVFCVSLEHADKIARAARAANIKAVMIDGKMDKALRREVVRDYSLGRLDWLVSVDLISEGFDCPGIEVGISLRPTQSTGLWLQQCGRILRVFPGKRCATILDHSGNSLRHGLPTEDRHWTLEGSLGVAKVDGKLSLRVCPKCFSAQVSGKAMCTNCGLTFAVEPRTVASRSGTLEELTPEKIAAATASRKARQAVGQTKTLASLVELGRLRNYKNPEAWAEYVMAGREKKGGVRP